MGRHRRLRLLSDPRDSSLLRRRQRAGARGAFAGIIDRLVDAVGTPSAALRDRLPANAGELVSAPYTKI